MTRAVFFKVGKYVVVIAFAESQAVALMVESQAGNQN